MSRPYAHVLSARRRALIELMFEKHGYTEKDVEDFFDMATMDRRFSDQLRIIRAAREKRKPEPVLRACQLDCCTD